MDTRPSTPVSWLPAVAMATTGVAGLTAITMALTAALPAASPTPAVSAPWDVIGTTGTIAAIDDTMNPGTVEVPAGLWDTDATVARVDGRGIPQLASDPDALVTVFLDFRGIELTDGSAWHTRWDYPDGMDVRVPSPMDASYQIVDTAMVYEIWQAVAEDFAPWHINVTTITPRAHELRADYPSDPRTGVRMGVAVAEAQSGAAACNHCRGTALPDSALASPAELDHWQVHGWVWVSPGDTPANIADALSHETAHTFGVGHASVGELRPATSPHERDTWVQTQEYFTGGTTWAPLMGSVHLHPVISTWDNGSYPGAHPHHDPIGVLDDALPRRNDDVGDSIATATRMELGDTQTGIITSATDVDAYTVTTSAWGAWIDVQTLAHPNLNVGIQLLDATSGAPVTTVMSMPIRDEYPAAGTGIQILIPARQAGTYTLLITGEPFTEQGSDYGSLGHYRVSVVHPNKRWN